MNSLLLIIKQERQSIRPEPVYYYYFNIFNIIQWVNLSTEHIVFVLNCTI